ncbi:unnamed protein product [Onchocerca flexuosa]|uniref:DUF3761 domain-containing protein n=1 Tax=Onchocerca flexuosa TaxID=387005 RepID=A0A183HUF8_9BILA|nr:unnamed protein product [Onchocerca flexuosa]
MVIAHSFCESPSLGKKRHQPERDIPARCGPTFPSMDEGKTWTYPMGKTWTYREQRCTDRASKGWARRSGRLCVASGGKARPFHALLPVKFG